MDLNNQNNTSAILDKNRTAYKTYGDSSYTLIFIHGVGMCGDIWEPQIEYFSKNHQVITYDFLGHGQSPLNKDGPQLDDYVEQLNNLVNNLNISKFFIVGHSMGALIGVEFALRYPQKVFSLIALNIVFNRNKKAHDDVLKRAKSVSEAKEILNINQTIERWFKNKNSPEDINKIEKVRNILKNTPPKGYGAAYRVFALSDKVFMNNLSEMKPAVLYLTGSEDPNSTVLMSKQMSQRTPGSYSRSFEGEAHMMAYISADKVNPVMEQFFIETAKIT